MTGLCKQIRKLFCFLEMKEEAISEFQSEKPFL